MKRIGGKCRGGLALRQPPPGRPNSSGQARICAGFPSLYSTQTRVRVTFLYVFFVRRRVKRRRYAGLILGAMLFTGIATGVTVTDRHVVPGPPLEPAALTAADDGRRARAPPQPAPPLAMPWAEVQAAGQSPSAGTAPIGRRGGTGHRGAAGLHGRGAARRHAAEMLTRMGVAPEDAQAAIRKSSTVWDPRDLRAGQKAAVFVQSDRLLSIRLALAPGRDVVVARDDSGGFVAEDQERPTNWVATLGPADPDQPVGGCEPGRRADVGARPDGPGVQLRCRLPARNPPR